MNEPPQEERFEHQERLQQLSQFCHALRRGIERSGLGVEKTLAIFRSNVLGECDRCGISVTGEELFALTEAPSAERSGPKIGRLRLGYCARRGCESYFCRLTFSACPQVDWAKLVATAKIPQARKGDEAATVLRIRSWLGCLARLEGTRRLGLAITVLLLVLLVRQLYFGGRVPLLREPEHFRVDLAPETTPTEEGAMPGADPGQK